ncbi:MAG: PIN domain-containing protein, partial [Nakamurella sp.]
MFTAPLDTCVLWPSLQRDILLSLAAEGMCRPAWRSAILAELHYAETAKHVRNGDIREMAEARAARLLIHMRRAFNDAEIRGWEGLEGTYGVPDPDDEHVLAAAAVAGAGAIVTGESEGLPRRPGSPGHPDTHPRAVRRGNRLSRPAPRAGRHPQHRPPIRPHGPTTDRRRAAR